MLYTTEKNCVREFFFMYIKKKVDSDRALRPKLTIKTGSSRVA